MAIQTLDNVGIVVEDIAAVTDFFVGLGLSVDGSAEVGGEWVDRVLGMEGVRSRITVLRTPDGHGRLELTQYLTPQFLPGDRQAPPNTHGIRRLAFTVDDLDAAVAGLNARGVELMSEVVQYENAYKLCYVRGPEGIMLMLAEPLGQ